MAQLKEIQTTISSGLNSHHGINGWSFGVLDTSLKEGNEKRDRSNSSEFFCNEGDGVALFKTCTNSFSRFSTFQRYKKKNSI